MLPIITVLWNIAAIFLIIQNAILHIIKIKTKQAINNKYFATTPAKIAAREVVSAPSDAFATALIIKFGICRFSRFVLNVSGLNSAAKTLFFENKEGKRNILEYL